MENYIVTCDLCDRDITTLRNQDRFELKFNFRMFSTWFFGIGPRPPRKIDLCNECKHDIFQEVMKRREEKALK